MAGTMVKLHYSQRSFSTLQGVRLPGLLPVLFSSIFFWGGGRLLLCFFSGGQEFPPCAKPLPIEHLLGFGEGHVGML